jgi:hypothetical protein
MTNPPPDLNLSDLIDEVLAEVTADRRGLCSTCSPDERAALTAAAHYTVVNLTFMAADASVTMSRKQLRKNIRKQTMADLRCGGFITVFAWLLRPLIMWAIRVMIDKLVDRFFQGK